MKEGHYLKFKILILKIMVQCQVLAKKKKSFTNKSSLCQTSVDPVSCDNMFTHIDGYEEFHGSGQGWSYKVGTQSRVLCRNPSQLTHNLLQNSNIT